MSRRSALAAAAIAVGVVATVFAGISSTAEHAYAADSLTLSVERTQNSASKSVEQAIARVLVAGGRVNEQLQPFPNGLKLAITVTKPNNPDVSTATLADEMKVVKLYDGGTAIELKPGVTKLAETATEATFAITFRNFPRYTVAEAGQQKAYEVRYQPQGYAAGQTVQVRLLNGQAPFVGQYSHYGSGTTDPLLGRGYTVTYGAIATTPVTDVITGPDLAPVRSAILSTYGITVNDRGHASLKTLQLIKSTLDTFGRSVIPTNVSEIRIRGYVELTSTSPRGFFVRNNGATDPAGFAELMTHEFHHNVRSLLRECLNNTSYCSQRGTAAGTFLGALFTRSEGLIQRAGTDPYNYLRQNVTLRNEINAQGSISGTPYSRAVWPVKFTTEVRSGSVNDLSPTVTFQTGPLAGQSFETRSYDSGILMVGGETEPSVAPRQGDTFTLRGGGGAVFMEKPQEFLASISNDWVRDSRATWSKCIAGARAGRSVMLDQCLLFVDLYSVGQSTTALFSINADGSITKTRTPVTKNNAGRVTSIPALGPEVFAFDTEGFVVLKKGDANMDGRIVATDALQILRSAVGQISGIGLPITDVNCSNSATVSDAILVLRAAVGSVPTPITCPAAQAAAVPDVQVARAGSGSGTVQVAGMTASGTETTFSFTATPASGSRFTGWSGACTGTGACAFTTNGTAAIKATANFEKTSNLGAAVALAFSSLTPPMFLLVLCEILFFIGFGLHYFYRDHRLALVTAVLALATGLLMLVNGLIG